MNHYYETNRKNWNERTPIHARSRFYDLDGFRAGRNALLPIELAEVGDVREKSLLHLQCHIGDDTLSWARLGARVTGVDFSEEALAVACGLRDELGLEARFIHTNIYDLPEVLNEQFDIVFSSYGVLCWLHDIPQWAEIAASYVKPGGCFYLAEFHPLQVSVCDSGIEGDTFRITFPYFPQAEPVYCEPGPTYTDGDEVTKTGTYEWPYSLGQVVTALCDAGLRIEFLHEHPCSACALIPGMHRDEDGLWWRETNDMPLMFSLKARKE
jgi:ubiquinone/menaquinone biosynthesis C-methylase UbiE